jgi:hypothetical protein
MKIPTPSQALDERFWAHRLRATSLAELIGGLACCGLFVYRHFVSGFYNWDLLAVAATMAIVKLVLMTWYRFTR